MDWAANFSALPVWAQVLAIITFAASAAVFVVVTKLGITAGRSGASQPSAPVATVAAVIVDPTALNNAAGEVAGLTVAVTEASVTARAHTAATDRLADRVDDLSEGIEKLRDQLVHVAANMK